ncbi:MAG: hypothetical protein Kow00124_07420 [Anaerolineae bacterium]
METEKPAPCDTCRTDLLIGAALFVAALELYVTTLASGLVFGDPAEYTFVPHIWGIMHPPGYAFQTVLGGLWQRLIPLGTTAYRANLLSAFAGAGITALVYGSVRTLIPAHLRGPRAYLPGVLAALSAAVAADIWQHSIHANAHIITALLAALSLFLLLRWWRSIEDGRPRDRWLYAFCVAAGVSVTHHPLLVFSFPAYATFILVVRPRILLQGRTLLKMMGFALLGLSVWLYLPLRASLPTPVPFGPQNTNTLNGFLNLVLARGLRVNLFHFGWADQPDRLLVLWSLLRLQVSLPLLVLMLVGLVDLWRGRWRTALLLSVFLVINLAFIINSIQDVMAYLLVPLVGLMLLIGAGLSAIGDLLTPLPDRRRVPVWTALAVLTLILPVYRAAVQGPLISLRHFDEADRWVIEVYSRFEGQGQGAVLLGHWEHLTPLWYAAWVEDRPFAAEDLTLVFVASGTARPWVDAVWANLGKGPVYVSGYQPDLIAEGFRLQPAGERLYRVLPPPATAMPAMDITPGRQAGPVVVAGVDLPEAEVVPGQRIPLTLALYAPAGTEEIIFPYTVLGDVTMAYTTDGHWLSPWWEPGEIIVERYDLRAPLDAPPGEYPLRLGLRSLTTGEVLMFDDGAELIDLGTVTIRAERPDRTDLPRRMLADIGHQVALVSARASARGQRVDAVWGDPLRVRPGDAISITITWAAIRPPDDNWKVFLHLLDAGNHVIAQQDFPPLGGSFPTYLWFPKWVPGQTVIDPYHLVVPPAAPAGEYRIAVGLYGFNTQQRLHFFDSSGSLSGDHFILGTVQVEP